MADRLLVFAHGAGAGSAHPWMQRWAERLRTLGEVVCFDYDYVKRGKRAPDKLDKLLETHRAALRNAKTRHGEAPVFLVGKSMGSRVGCHLALEEAVQGAICFGYPLRAPSGKVRDQVLLELRTPVLFVQGSRDNLCPLELLAKVRARMQAKSELFVVDEGDHSLNVTKRALARAGETQDAVDQRILSEIKKFVEA